MIQSIIKQRKESGKTAKNEFGRLLRFPHAIERRYQKILRNYIERFNKRFREKFIERLPAFVDQMKSKRPDQRDDEDLPTQVAELINSINLSFTDENEALTVLLMRDVANAVAEFNLVDFQKLMKPLVGIDLFNAEPWLADQTAAFIERNKILIKGLTAEETKNLMVIAQNGLANGTQAKDIGRELTARFGIAKRRAELIARDQVATFNGNLTKLRQTEVGITHYRWKTSGDERVRSLHQEFADRIFKWDEPPQDGHPGIAINCRCIAQPIIPDD